MTDNFMRKLNVRVSFQVYELIDGPMYRQAVSKFDSEISNDVWNSLVRHGMRESVADLQVTISRILTIDYEKQG